MNTDFHSEPTMYANPAHRPQPGSYEELPEPLAYSDELLDQAPSLRLQEVNRPSKRNSVAMAVGLIAAIGATALVLAPFYNTEPISDRSAVVVPGAEANPAPAVPAPEQQPGPNPIAGAAGGHQDPANGPVSRPANDPAPNRQAPAAAATSPGNQGGAQEVKGPDANVGIAPGDAAAGGPAVLGDIPLPELPPPPSLRDLLPPPPVEAPPAKTPPEETPPACGDGCISPPKVDIGSGWTPPVIDIVDKPVVVHPPLELDLSPQPQPQPQPDLTGMSPQLPTFER